jgi:hypothetical protein
MLMNSSAPPKKMACHCGWCGAVRQLDGSWDFVDESPARSEMVTHGICPDCAAAFRADAAIGRPSQPHQETFERTPSACLMASF